MAFRIVVVSLGGCFAIGGNVVLTADMLNVQPECVLQLQSFDNLLANLFCPHFRKGHRENIGTMVRKSLPTVSFSGLVT